MKQLPSKRMVATPNGAPHAGSSKNEVDATEQCAYPAKMTAQLQELRALPVSERVQLVEDLWDSIAQDEYEYTLAPEQINLLDERLDALEKDPRGGTPWEVAKQRIISAL